MVTIRFFELQLLRHHHLSINQSINLSNYLSIYLSIGLSIYLFDYLSNYLPIYRLIYLSMFLSANDETFPSANERSNYHTKQLYKPSCTRSIPNSSSGAAAWQSLGFCSSIDFCTRSLSLPQFHLNLQAPHAPSPRRALGAYARNPTMISQGLPSNPCTL